MNKKEFKDLLQKKRLILDGATGSNLIKRGNMPSGICPELWILENPEVLIGLQEDYLNAGSNIVYSPTFTANRVKLAEYKLDNKLEDMNKQLVALSKEAVRRVKAKGCNKPMFVAGDLTMTGRQLIPMGDMSVTELIDIYKEQITALVKAGVDLLVVETMMSLQECRCAVIAANEVAPDMPVMVSMSFEGSGRALYGTDPVTALVTLQALGADAFGVNCSAGPDTMIDMIRELVKYSHIPVICKPNAGMPSLLPDGTTGYSMDHIAFKNAMRPIIEAGVSLLGGCCGTAPEYIKAIEELVSECKYNPQFVINSSIDDDSDYLRFLSSERSNIKFDLNSSFIIVGERINPTGKKALQAELRDGIFEIVRDFAQQQEEHGAKVLDVNMGMSGIDEKATMLKAIEEITQVSNLPLAIDSSDPEVMETALIHYPGRALVNSVSLEEIKIKKMLPLVKKYGAMMILLPLSDEGLPKDLNDKKRIINEVLKHASNIGISKKDIIVDGLVATVGANKNAALETLETIRYCKEELNLPTVCGLSNISFGLPERSFVNASFLTMAIMSGLTMAISNPNQDLLANTAFACDLLRNKENADINYIEQINRRKDELDSDGAVISLYGGKKIIPSQLDKNEATATAKSVEADGKTLSKTEDAIYNAVIKGNRDRIVEYTKLAVNEGQKASHILNDLLLVAINKVGEYFEKGRYFLPQLISSAEAMEKSIEYLEPLLKSEGAGGEEKGTVIIATVKGDIHDIGKNLVTLMLKNNGFTVYDLGKDITKEEIVDTAIEKNADIIGLSALMTTTMKQMEDVIQYAKEKNCKAKIMIGGAVITQEYADEIGADGFSPDANEAVKLALKLIEL